MTTKTKTKRKPTTAAARAAQADRRAVLRAVCRILKRARLARERAQAGPGRGTP